MTYERAAEILDPEHRETYESLEIVNEACRMGRAALFRRMPEPPHPDGPVENGWNFCPGCGHEIEVEAVSPCPFDNGNCMCQFCEAQCNNGLNCSDCRYEGKPVHDIHLCTGFVGDITQYIRNWMRHHGGKADT